MKVKALDLMGLDYLFKLITHPSFNGETFLLETPNVIEGYKTVFELLKRLV